MHWASQQLTEDTEETLATLLLLAELLSNDSSLWDVYPLVRAPDFTW